MRTFPRTLVFLLLAAGLSLSTFAFAGWPENGVPICTAEAEQATPLVTWDSAGGAIVTWVDPRDPITVEDVYAQRVDVNGLVRWTLDGVPLCEQPILQGPRDIATDGHGGAIVVWHDYRNASNWDIYAQRVDSSGTPVWTANGVAICTAPYDQTQPRVVPDGLGGAFIVWQDMRGGGNWDVYAQRVNASGVVQWASGGVAVSAESEHNQILPRIAADSEGGIYVVWEDARGELPDIFGQRLSSSGNPLWTVDGIPICAATGSQASPGVMSDGVGAAIVIWRDQRDNIQWDIYAQRVGPSGSKEWSWAPDGIAVSAAAGDDGSARMAPDGAGGAIITWVNATDYDIFVQRVNCDGNVRWTTNGVPACTAPHSGSRADPDICSDLHQGAIITWEEDRVGGANGYDIYAQRVDSTGALVWPGEAISICVTTGWQAQPQCVSNGSGGAIIAWRDRRPPGNGDIYAMRVKADGTTDVLFASAAATVKSGAVTLSWQVTVDVPVSSFHVRRADSRGGGFVPLDAVVRKETRTEFICTDYSVVAGNTYWYEIVLAGFSGEEVCGPIEVSVGTVPSVYWLYQNYPNPFNPSCNIRYEVPRASMVKLEVLDARGSVVRTFVGGWREPGTYWEVWDGRSSDGSLLPSGVYFYRLEAGDFAVTRKMILLR